MSFAKSATSAAPRSLSRTPARIACASFDVKKAVEIRKDVDKKRVERIKEIGVTLDHIARTEVKQSAETLKTFMPFLENLKDFKGITKKDVESFFAKKSAPPAEPREVEVVDPSEDDTFA